MFPRTFFRPKSFGWCHSSRASHEINTIVSQCNPHFCAVDQSLPQSPFSRCRSVVLRTSKHSGPEGSARSAFLVVGTKKKSFRETDLVSEV